MSNNSAKENTKKPLKNPTQTVIQFIKEVQSTLEYAKNQEYIDKDMLRILFRSHPRVSNPYLLPKIHKKNNSGRPNINSVGNLTETLSAFGDEIFRKYSKLAKSYVKGTTHFLQLTMNLEIEEKELLCTVDIMTLYTNIPHKDEVKKVLNFLRKHRCTVLMSPAKHVDRFPEIKKY